MRRPSHIQGDGYGRSQVLKDIASGTPTMLQWMVTDPAVRGQNKFELIVIKFKTRDKNMQS